MIDYLSPDLQTPSEGKPLFELASEFRFPAGRAALS